MKIIFCADPLAPGQPDAAYEREARAAAALGLEWRLINLERLIDEDDAAGAVRRIPAAAAGGELAIYRGWMLRPRQYAALYAALQGKGLELINTPAAYQHCHYLPESYPLIEGRTPRTVWLDEAGGLDLGRVLALLAPFGDAPLIVKDYVKSQKHAWHEACFIPSASDQAAVARVVGRFLELQGADLCGGLVLREFVPFQPIGRHPQSGMPLTEEYRLWILDGRCISAIPYWAEAEYSAQAPPDLFAAVARQVRSRFFTMDVARRRDGGWMIVELGDGQVAGLPDHAPAAPFYQALRDGLAGA